MLSYTDPDPKYEFPSDPGFEFTRIRGRELRAVKLEGGCCRVYELKGHYFQIRFSRMSTLGRHSHTFLAILLKSKIKEDRGHAEITQYF